MTLFAFIKQCLRREAARTEPDCTKTIQKVLNVPEKLESKQKRPP